MDPKRELEILNGGCEIEIEREVKEGGKLVRLLDKVFIRDIPARERAAIGQALATGEAAEAQLYTGKDQAWLDTLTHESFDRIIEEGQRLNLTKGSGWLKARARVALATDTTGRLREVAERANAEIEARIASASAPSSST